MSRLGLLVLTCVCGVFSDFKTTWKTTVANEIIMLPIFNVSGGSSVDWGDNQTLEVLDRVLMNHTYSTAGLYNVSINGTVRNFRFNSSYSMYASKLIEVLEWGNFEIGPLGDNTSTSNEGIFTGCINLVRVPGLPIDQPTMLPNASLKLMFQDAIKFNSPLSWDLTNVTSLESMFQNAAQFNSRVNFSNTNSVESMKWMFQNAISFNQPVAFRADSLTNVESLFYGATAFNSTVNFTNCSQLTSLSSMFFNAVSFNQPLDQLQTDNVLDMSAMFRGASSFNQPVPFNTSQVLGMSEMFFGAIRFNQPVNFDTQKVMYMDNMFRNASSFNQPVNFTTSIVERMGSMFAFATQFNQIVNFDTSLVKDTAFMFASATSFNQTVQFADTSQLTTMESMFEGATSFNQPVNFNTRNVTNMKKMFANASQFNQNITFDTGKVTNMEAMFTGATKFNQTLNFLNLSSVSSCSNFCDLCIPPTFTRCQPCTLFLQGNSTQYACGCPNKDCGQILILLNGTEDTTFVLTDPSNSSTTVHIPSGLLNGTLLGNIVPSNTTVSTSIISLVLQNSTGQSQSVSNLSTPFTITFELKIPMNPNAVTQCMGTQYFFAPVYPTCGFRDPTTSKWETAGCHVANFNSTHVQCNCTHFTLFAALSPKYNKIVPTAVLELTPSNVAANPTGLVTAILLLCLFGVVFVLAALRDRKEAAEYATLRAVKRDKWEKFAADKQKATLGKKLKIAFQKRHTWFSLVFRKSGTSFRSVDRTFVALLMVFLSMSVSAFFHAQDNNGVVRGLVVLITVAVSLVSSQLLTLLFVRTGPMGFYEEWEHARKPPRTNKCLSYRFPERCRVVWRGVTVAVVAGLLIFVLMMSMNFDRQPLYYCKGEAAGAWVSTWLATYAASVLLVEPLRIVLWALIMHWAKYLFSCFKRSSSASTTPPGSFINLGSAEPSQGEEGKSGCPSPLPTSCQMSPQPSPRQSEGKGSSAAAEEQTTTEQAKEQQEGKATEQDEKEEA